MMERLLKEGVGRAVRSLYGKDLTDNLLQVQKTKREFSGDYTVVVFPLLKISGRSPEITGNEIGKFLLENSDAVCDFNVIKGFLNITIAPSVWRDRLIDFIQSDDFGFKKATNDSPLIVVEYSSPNTNKPLHLGHIRNNLLGYSLSRIINAAGNRVIRTNIVNDRGIHICKSMVAWKLFGNNETPESTGKKGDHLVGEYYVRFDREYKSQVAELKAIGKSDAEAGESAPILLAAREMLLKWEAGDKETLKLWTMMNSWVYAGFDVTYKSLGVEFDKIYYESETFKKGKDLVLDALEKNILFRKDDGSVWADLTSDKLDQKLLLRSDGTAVYMTQDLGTAYIRYSDYHFDQHIYVVGNEQNYHFQVLALILQKMGFNWASGLHHFSYGMVELPEGKMKSREGTVVDADDLILEMTDTARSMSLELGKLNGFSDSEKEEVYNTIGLAALKYYILKVDPKKNMTFNPVESIDFNGNTGPFIQYTYTRIRSVIKKGAETGNKWNDSDLSGVIPNQKEINVLKLINEFPEIVSEASAELSPALIANFCYDIAKEFNQFYHDYSILGEEDTSIRDFRLCLSEMTGKVIKSGLWLLGIEVPERM
jgi:arginyl-tRNA synthetase